MVDDDVVVDGAGAVEDVVVLELAVRDIGLGGGPVAASACAVYSDTPDAPVPPLPWRFGPPASEDGCTWCGCEARSAC